MSRTKPVIVTDGELKTDGESVWLEPKVDEFVPEQPHWQIILNTQRQILQVAPEESGSHLLEYLLYWTEAIDSTTSDCEHTEKVVEIVGRMEDFAGFLSNKGLKIVPV